MWAMLDNTEAIRPAMSHILTMWHIMALLHMRTMLHIGRCYICGQCYIYGRCHYSFRIYVPLQNPIQIQKSELKRHFIRHNFVNIIITLFFKVGQSSLGVQRSSGTIAIVCLHHCYGKQCFHGNTENLNKALI